MIAAMNNALSGMLAQQTRLAGIASNVANADTPGYKPVTTAFSTQQGGGVSASVRDDGDGDVDMASAMTELSETKTAFAANAAVFETGATIWDLLMTIPGNRDRG